MNKVWRVTQSLPGQGGIQALVLRQHGGLCVSCRAFLETLLFTATWRLFLLEFPTAAGWIRSLRCIHHCRSSGWNFFVGRFYNFFYGQDYRVGKSEFVLQLSGRGGCAPLIPPTVRCVGNNVGWIRSLRRIHHCRSSGWIFFIGSFTIFFMARTTGLASLSLFGKYSGVVDALRLSPLRFDVLETT